jgi:hypothetical protein
VTMRADPEGGIGDRFLRATSGSGRLTLGPLAELTMGLVAAVGGAVLLVNDLRVPAALLILLAMWRGGIGAMLAERDGPTWVRATSAAVNIAAEGLIIGASAVWLRRNADLTGPLALGYLAFAGVLLLAYARVRIRASGGLDLQDGPGGVASREVRLLLVALGAAIGSPVYWALVAVALLTHGTVLGHLARLRGRLTD